MPELPEVETTRRGLAPHVTGARIRELRVHEARLRWPVPRTLAQQLRGQTLRSLQRRGKYLLFELDNFWLIGHLGMSGSWRVITDDSPRRLHDHLELVFDNGVLLRYHDPRRFGCLLPASDPAQHALLAELGPEPLSDDFHAGYLHARAQKKKVAVKAFVMDTHVVVGVGNIYAQEACFAAGIHPQRAAGRISLTRYELLVAAIKDILGHAIARGGTTLRDFINSDGEPGYFAQELNVYGRSGESCKRCATPLKEIRLSNRGTWFCPNCQK